MTKRIRFDSLRDFSYVTPPYRGAVYMQDGHHFNGDHVHLPELDPPDEGEAEVEESVAGVKGYDADSPDAGRDYSGRRPLHDPNPPNPLESQIMAIPTRALAEVKKRWLRDLRGAGVNVGDNGAPVTKGELADLIESDAKGNKGASLTNARPVADTGDEDEGEDETSTAKRPAKKAAKAPAKKAAKVEEEDLDPELQGPNAYKGVDPETSLKLWLTGNLPEDRRAPTFKEVNGWAKDKRVFGKSFGGDTAQDDLIDHAISEKFVSAKAVKVRA